MKVQIGKLFDNRIVQIIAATLGSITVLVTMYLVYSSPVFGFPSVKEQVDNMVMVTVFGMMLVAILGAYRVIGRALSLIGVTMMLIVGLALIVLAAALVLALVAIPAALILGVLFALTVVFAVAAVVVGLIVAVGIFVIGWLGFWEMFLTLARSAMILHYHANNQTE